MHFREKESFLFDSCVHDLVRVLYKDVGFFWGELGFCVSEGLNLRSVVEWLRSWRSVIQLPSI
jgi:hypothetical protein